MRKKYIDVLHGSCSVMNILPCSGCLNLQKAVFGNMYRIIKIIIELLRRHLVFSMQHVLETLNYYFL
jgi:hypothetical protein